MAHPHPGRRSSGGQRYRETAAVGGSVIVREYPSADAESVPSHGGFGKAAGGSVQRLDVYPQRMQCLRIAARAAEIPGVVV